MTKDSYGGFNVTCKTCDSPFIVYTRLLENDCDRGDSIRRKRDCPLCGQLIVIVWDRDHNLPFNRDASSDLKLSGLD
jgi:hypothetical protein